MQTFLICFDSIHFFGYELDEMMEWLQLLHMKARELAFAGHKHLRIFERYFGIVVVFCT